MLVPVASASLEEVRRTVCICLELLTWQHHQGREDEWLTACPPVSISIQLTAGLCDMSCSSASEVLTAYSSASALTLASHVITMTVQELTPEPSPSPDVPPASEPAPPPAPAPEPQTATPAPPRQPRAARPAAPPAPAKPQRPKIKIRMTERAKQAMAASRPKTASVHPLQPAPQAPAQPHMAESVGLVAPAVSAQPPARPARPSSGHILSPRSARVHPISPLPSSRAELTARPVSGTPSAVPTHRAAALLSPRSARVHPAPHAADSSRGARAAEPLAMGAEAGHGGIGRGLPQTILPQRAEPTHGNGSARPVLSPRSARVHPAPHAAEPSRGVAATAQAVDLAAEAAELGQSPGIGQGLPQVVQQADEAPAGGLDAVWSTIMRQVLTRHTGRLLYGNFL